MSSDLVYSDVVDRICCSGGFFSFAYHSQLPKVQKEYARLLKIAREKAAKFTCNRVLILTMPFSHCNGKYDYVSPSKALGRTPVNRLKRRIKWDILGNNKLGQGIRTAVPDNAGGFLYRKNKAGKMESFFRGSSSMPFVVADTRGRKRKRAVKLRDQVTSVDELIRRIEQNTRLTLNKKRKLIRTFKKGSTPFWTNLTTARKAAAQMQERAGYLLSGWSALAKATNNGPSLGKILSRTYADAFGSAFLRETEDSTFLSASNGGSLFQGATRWQQHVLNKRVPFFFRDGFYNEVLEANIQIKKFIKTLTV